MRYLLKEQPYERPLAAGTLVYERESGVPSVLEHWRLTEALDGYRFFRIDLDERAVTGRSLLFHLLLNEQNRVENLRFRLFSPRQRGEGQVIIEKEMVTVVRTVDDKHFEDELPGMSGEFPLFVPTAAGLSLVRPWAGHGPAAGLMLNSSPSREGETAEEWFAPRRVTVSCELRPDAVEGEQQMVVSWRAAGGETAEARVTLTVRDPHTAVIGATWASGGRRAAGKAIHYQRSGR